MKIVFIQAGYLSIICDNYMKKGHASCDRLYTELVSRELTVTSSVWTTNVDLKILKPLA